MRIETVANSGIVLVCALLAATLTVNLTRSMHASSARAAAVSSRTPPTDGLQEGTTLKDTSELKLSSSSKTLVMLTASSCHYCTESMPFYQQLVAHARERHIPVVAATREDPRINEKYLEIHGVKADRTVSATTNSISAPGTPTLILVDSSGKILKVWRGKLAKDAEESVLTARAGA